MTQEEKKHLKPCPFCGGQAVISPVKNKGFRIKCTKCLIQKVQKVLHMPTTWLENKMIEDWNNCQATARVEDLTRERERLKLKVDEIEKDQRYAANRSIKYEQENTRLIARVKELESKIREGDTTLTTKIEALEGLVDYWQSKFDKLNREQNN